jgi:hypothetical protein
MDNSNRFQSKTTFMLLRAEYAVALTVCVVAFFAHIDEVRWVPAVLLFAYIDVFGYLPGFIMHRRAENHEISRVYYVLYNTMHSFVTQSVVVGLWIWIHGFEWALLVIPIHLCGDRAIFGNLLKPFSVPFDPISQPPTLTATSQQAEMPTARTLATAVNASDADGAAKLFG